MGTRNDQPSPSLEKEAAWQARKANHKAEGMVGYGVKFQRIRRITGYLVGTLDRFNNAKRAEERDRVKHG